MGLYEEIESFFSDEESIDRYGNSGQDYLIAIILFFGSYFVIYITKTVLLGRLKKWIDERNLSETAEDLITKTQKSISKNLIFIISISVGVTPITLNSAQELSIDFILYLTLSYYLLKLLYLGVDIVIALQKKYSNQSTANMNEFLRLVLKTTITVIILIWFLSNLGIDTTAFIASLGVFALAIAFALQNVISDIFAALVIYIDKPIEIGDFIQIGADIGQVEKIGIRSTRIRILTGHLLIVSNREIINSRIYNFKRMERRRVAFTLGISMKTPLTVVKEIPSMIERLIKQIENTQFDRVFLNTINKFSFDFDIVYYVLSRSYSEYQSVHQEVNLRIIEALEQKAITIPYPTQFIQVQRIVGSLE